MSKKTGATLLEFLVAVAIIGLLTGLILSAVQKARASAARAQCVNLLRQLALSNEQFHSTHNRLPAGYSSDARPKEQPYLSWTARLLPFVEQQSVWTQIQDAFHTDPRPTVFFGHMPHGELLKRVVPSFLCPSDDRVAFAQNVNGVTAAFSSYLGVSGTNFIQKDGIFHSDSRIRWPDILDGLSNTLLIGERPPSADFRLGWWYRGWGLYHDGTGEMLLGVRERNMSGDYLKCSPGPYHFRSARFSNECALFQFWSPHSGGSHFAFADGSVRFLRYSANDILPALATRAGAESVVVCE